MISRSPKKHRTTARNTDHGNPARVSNARRLLLVTLMVTHAGSDVAPLLAQELSPTNSWTNRRSWTTQQPSQPSAAAAPAPLRQARSLAWQPPLMDGKPIRSNSTRTSIVLSRSSGASGIEKPPGHEFPVASFPPTVMAMALGDDGAIRDQLVQSYEHRRKLPADANSRPVGHSVPVTHRFSPSGAQASHANPFGDSASPNDPFGDREGHPNQSSRGKTTADSTPDPFADPFADPFSDAADRPVASDVIESHHDRPARFRLTAESEIASETEPEALQVELATTNNQDGIESVAGQSPPIAAPKAPRKPPAKFRLASLKTPPPMLIDATKGFTKDSERERNDAIQPAAPNAMSPEGTSNRIALHDAVVAFTRPAQLQLDPFGEDLPIPQAELEPGDPMPQVPNFPKETTPRSQPPSPESVPGNRDLPSLPELVAPRRPADASEGENALPTPGDPRLPSFSDLDDEEDSFRDDGRRGDASAGPDSDASEDRRQKRANCDRIYNERDCCEAEEYCREVFTVLNSTKIEDISISIAPPLVPLTKDETDLEEQRERLSESPIRDWRNRNDRVIGTGRLDDIIDNHIVIRTQDGSQQQLPFYELSKDDICFVTAWWRLPNECVDDREELAIRDFTMMTYTWTASGVCHKPLYFEDVQLERYGHSAGPWLQPLVSGAHFFANIALLPYHMGVYPPNECRYVLGYYRPGSCAPWMVPAFPLSRRGLAFEVLGIAGFTGVF